MSALLAALRRWFCSHECVVDDIRRVSPERVQCPCRRCGKVLTATAGLYLPAALKRRWE